MPNKTQFCERASDMPCLKRGHELFIGKYDVIFIEGSGKEIL
jgi:hypothetical protein